MKIGILGAGQLARMLAFAARPMGLHPICFAKEKTATIEHVCEVFSGDLIEFEKQVDVITYETENIDLASIALLADSEKLQPNFNVLKIAQDRLLEKQLFRSLNASTADFIDVHCKEDLSKLGFPAILKTRLYGYDGKGQAVIRNMSDVDAAWDLMQGQPLILEQCIPFDRELSMIAVRSLTGEISFYPLTENSHQAAILHCSIAPFDEPLLQAKAEIIAANVLMRLNYVGVLAIELFQLGDQLLVNEMAPRVHNSGHWTIEGAVTSQFANHIRAICGLPLGSTAARGYSAMINIIGEPIDRKKILAIPNAYFHDYEKEARPNRKLGHITLVCDRKDQLEEQLFNINCALY